MTEAELADHMEIDHHADPSEFDRFHYKAKTSRPPGKRYLVVANRTLEEPALFERIQSLATEGAHFHIVAPATPFEAGVAVTDDKGLGLATYRLRYMVDKLHGAGIDAEGEVGAPDPLRAVTRAFEHEPADEIIVSTLPQGASRWLDVDVPAALRRRYSVPVTVMTTS
jgi:GABA permease